MTDCIYEEIHTVDYQYGNLESDDYSFDDPAGGAINHQFTIAAYDETFTTVLNSSDVPKQGGKTIHLALWFLVPIVYGYGFAPFWE